MFSSMRWERGRAIRFIDESRSIWPGGSRVPGGANIFSGLG